MRNRLMKRLKRHQQFSVLFRTPTSAAVRPSAHPTTTGEFGPQSSPMTPTPVRAFLLSYPDVSNNPAVEEAIQRAQDSTPLQPTVSPPKQVAATPPLDAANAPHLYEPQDHSHPTLAATERSVSPELPESLTWPATMESPLQPTVRPDTVQRTTTADTSTAEQAPANTLSTNQAADSKPPENFSPREWSRLSTILRRHEEKEASGIIDEPQKPSAEAPWLQTLLDRQEVDRPRIKPQERPRPQMPSPNQTPRRSQVTYMNATNRLNPSNATILKSNLLADQAPHHKKASLA